jgi:hypothetical protein
VYSTSGGATGEINLSIYEPNSMKFQFRVAKLLPAMLNVFRPVCIQHALMTYVRAACIRRRFQ